MPQSSVIPASPHVHWTPGPLAPPGSDIVSTTPWTCGPFPALQHSTSMSPFGSPFPQATPQPSGILFPSWGVIAGAPLQTRGQLASLCSIGSLSVPRAPPPSAPSPPLELPSLSRTTVLHLNLPHPSAGGGVLSRIHHVWTQFAQFHSTKCYHCYSDLSSLSAVYSLITSFKYCVFSSPLSSLVYVWLCLPACLHVDCLVNIIKYKVNLSSSFSCLLHAAQP